MNVLIFIVVGWGGAWLAGQAVRDIVLPVFRRALDRGNVGEALGWVVFAVVFGGICGYSWGAKWSEWLL